MGIMSIALFYSGLFQSVFKYSLEAMLYMSICLIIIFYGFISFNEEKIKSVEIDNLNVYMVIETTLIIGGFSAILFFIPFAIKGLSGDVELNRINNGIFQQKVLASYGIVNSLLSLFANLFILAIVFSFINFSRGPKFKIRAYLLLLSSFSYVIYILAYVGRDGIAYWLLSFIFVFFLMKNFLNSSLVKKIRLFFILFLVAASFFFFFIII